jgi:hypothetical protein
MNRIQRTSSDFGKEVGWPPLDLLTIRLHSPPVPLNDVIAGSWATTGLTVVDSSTITPPHRLSSVPEDLFSIPSTEYVEQVSSSCGFSRSFTQGFFINHTPTPEFCFSSF